MFKKFFYKQGDFQPPYMYMFMSFVSAVASFIMASMKLLPYDFATTCIATFLGTFSALVALYNWDAKNKNLKPPTN